MLNSDQKFGWVFSGQDRSALILYQISRSFLIDEKKVIHKMALTLSSKGLKAYLLCDHNALITSANALTTFPPEHSGLLVLISLIYKSPVVIKNIYHES